jgi:hypothetical protein
MTASRTLRKAVALATLAAVVGLYWLIAAACDLASPRLKWFVIPAMLAMTLLVFARSFTRGVKKYVNATEAYAHRDIDTAALPSTFRFITHDRHFKKSSSASVPLRASSNLRCGIVTETPSTSRDMSMTYLTMPPSSSCHSVHSSRKIRSVLFTCAKRRQTIGFQSSRENVI